LMTYNAGIYDLTRPSGLKHYVMITIENAHRGIYKPGI
jgi:hypothetical protein